MRVNTPRQNSTPTAYGPEHEEVPDTSKILAAFVIETLPKIWWIHIHPQIKKYVTWQMHMNVVIFLYSMLSMNENIVPSPVQIWLKNLLAHNERTQQLLSQSFPK